MNVEVIIPNQQPQVEVVSPPGATFVEVVGDPTASVAVEAIVSKGLKGDKGDRGDKGDSGGATIPDVTNLISGDGAGNGADSGIAPSSVVLKQPSYPTPTTENEIIACLRAANLCA